MNNKNVARTALAIAIVIFVVILGITLKNKFFKGASETVKISCNASVTTGPLRKDDSFKCNLMGTDFTFTVKSIEKDKIVIKANQYGVIDSKDATVDLTAKKDTFEVVKGNTLTLRPQATDNMEKLDITWE